MNNPLATLKELHALLTELADAREGIQRNPLLLKARQDDMARREDRFNQEREAVRRVRIEADQQELTLKTGEQRVRDLRVKLNMAKSNKEYTALTDEIAKLTVDNGALEEKILEAMTAYDDKSSALELSRQSLEIARGDFAKFKELTEYKTQKLRDRVGILEAKIVEVEGQLDPETKANYLRLTKLKGARALAALDGRTCTECYTELTPQGLSELRAGKPVLCKNCGAMLYA